MPLTEAAQWRIHVIAAFPLAPNGDKKGFRSQAVAQESMNKCMEVTAYLDTDATHSYISFTLALQLLGEEGLRLAQSAGHEMQLGQVGTILSCDDSQHTQTENFLLSDMDGVDMLLSRRSWMSLERQCPTLSLSDKLTSSCESWSYSFPVSKALEYHQPHNSSFERVQILTWAPDSCASSGTPDPGSDDERSENGSHTHCSTSGDCPSPTLCCQTGNDIAQTCSRNSKKTPDLSLREYHLPFRIAQRSDSRPTSQVGLFGTRRDTPAGTSQPPCEEKSLSDVPKQNTWSWDPKRQNYYCRDRDEDDEWYWYPTDIV